VNNAAIETWPRIPAAIRDHLVDRMHDRNISLDDLNQLRVWLETKPTVPEGRWFKDFGSFKLCGEGKYPKTFLLAGQAATGEALEGSDRK
jgi:hypothetical protein